MCLWRLSGSTDTLVSMNNLGAVFYQEEDDATGLTFRQVLDKRVVDRAHPDTLTSMNNLALLLYQKGNYDQAEDTYLAALLSCEIRLQEGHPTTLASKKNLALVLREQGKLDEAKIVHRQALKLAETKIKTDRPAKWTSSSAMANSCWNRHQTDIARNKGDAGFMTTAQMRLLIGMFVSLLRCVIDTYFPSDVYKNALEIGKHIEELLSLLIVRFQHSMRNKTGSRFQ